MKGVISFLPKNQKKIFHLFYLVDIFVFFPPIDCETCLNVNVQVGRGGGGKGPGGGQGGQGG